jgi:pantothenate kinase
MYADKLFMYAMYDLKIISDDEMKIYLNWYNYFITNFYPKIDAFIYLNTSVDTCV